MLGLANVSSRSSASRGRERNALMSYMEHHALTLTLILAYSAMTLCSLQLQAATYKSDSRARSEFIPAFPCRFVGVGWLCMLCVAVGFG